MLVGHLALEQPAGGEVVEERAIGVLHEDAGEPRHGVVERAVGVDRVEHGQALGAPGVGVVFAERGSGVHEAGAVGGGHVVSDDDSRCGFVERQVGEGPVVVPPDEVATGEARDDLAHALAEVAVDGRLREHEVAPRRRAAQLHVDDVGTGGDRDVRDERPRRRGPHEEVGVGRATGGDREAHVRRRVDDVLVALRDFVARERGAAARAVGGDPVALVDEALVPHLADDPPDRFDVLVGQRPVRVLRVDPDTRSLGERGPVFDVARHRVAAALGELRDAERLDLVLVGEPELLLDLDLDGKPVAVPAALAGDVVATHRLEARVEVFEDTGPHVMEAGTAVRGGRALVEDPGLGALAQPLGLFDDLARPPSRQHSFLERDEVEVGIDRAERHGAMVGEHLHRSWASCAVRTLLVAVLRAASAGSCSLRSTIGASRTRRRTAPPLECAGMHPDLYDSAGEDAIVLRVHAQPGAGRSTIVGRYGDALKVKVAAPPQGGRANGALVTLLAHEFGVKDAQVSLVGGESSRGEAVPHRGSRARTRRLVARSHPGRRG